MNPGLVLALMMLLLVLIPLAVVVETLLFKVLLVLALSKDNEERKTAMVTLALGALRRK